MTMQVLLLDDSPDQLLIRSEMLRRAKIQSLAVSSAEEALQLLSTSEQSEQIGVIVTDHLMPGIGGVEFVRQLRTFNASIPVIVMSGLPNADDAYDGLNITFRNKPCDPDDFIAVVGRALKSYRAISGEAAS
jgi:DNA-binding NtrC family response regulator